MSGRVRQAWVVGLLVLGTVGCDAGQKPPPPSPPKETPPTPAEKPGKTPPAASDRLRIGGSSTMTPLITAVAGRFHTSQPATGKIDITAGGSERGLSDLRDGKIDIAMVSRTAGEGERDLQVFPIARDGLCLIVHRDNPVSSLTGEQVRDIYEVRIKNWKDVGGKPGPIVVVARASGHAASEIFEEAFKVDHEKQKATLVVGDADKTIKAVSTSKGAIGYVSIGQGADSVSSRKAAIKMLPMNGIYPLTRNVRNHTFPLSRDLNLMTMKKPEGLAEQFIKYCLSSQIDDLIKDQFFVDIND